jgi:hypothetical protein
MKTFTRLQAAVTMDYPSRDGCHVWLYADASQGKVAADWFTCNVSKYSWDGHDVRYDNEEDVPALRSDLDGKMSDVWGELRSGFAHSQVQSVDQDAVGINGFRGDWSKVTLPFPWASAYTIYAGIQRGNHQMVEMEIWVGPTKVFEMSVESVVIDAPVSAAHLSPDVGAGELPYEPNWTRL